MGVTGRRIAAGSARGLPLPMRVVQGLPALADMAQYTVFAQAATEAWSPGYEDPELIRGVLSRPRAVTLLCHLLGQAAREWQAGPEAVEQLWARGMSDTARILGVLQPLDPDPVAASEAEGEGRVVAAFVHAAVRLHLGLECVETEAVNVELPQCGDAGGRGGAEGPCDPRAGSGPG